MGRARGPLPDAALEVGRHRRSRGFRVRAMAACAAWKGRVMSGVFVIAEAGVNHNGDLSLALRLCDAARAAGADAVKFQTFRAEDLVVPGAPTAQYQARETGQQDQFALLQKLELSLDQHQTIQAHCKKIGIEFFSTPFSVPAVDMLVGLGVARIKLSSGEITHRALVERAAAARLPLLVST